MNKVKYIVLSVLSLLNVMFIPCFSIWGGLLPAHPESNFFSEIESILSGKGDFSSWSVIIILSVLIPSVAMLVGALINNRIVFMIASIAGVVLWLRFAVSYISQYGMDHLLDFKDGSVSIGTWFAAVLFFTSVIVAIASPGKKPKPAQAYYRGNPYNNNYPYNTNYPNSINHPNNNNYPYNNSPNRMSGGAGTVNYRNVQNSQPAAFCPQCGARYTAGESFCGRCGHKY